MPTRIYIVLFRFASLIIESVSLGTFTPFTKFIEFDRKFFTTCTTYSSEITLSTESSTTCSSRFRVRSRMFRIQKERTSTPHIGISFRTKLTLIDTPTKFFVDELLATTSSTPMLAYIFFSFLTFLTVLKTAISLFVSLESTIPFCSSFKSPTTTTLPIASSTSSFIFRTFLFSILNTSTIAFSCFSETFSIP